VSLLAVPCLYPYWNLSPWSSVPALLFQSIALLCFLLAVTAPKPAVHAWLGGTSVGLTFLCRQPVGGFTFAALLAAFLSLAIFPDRRHAGTRCVLAFLAGFGLVILTFVASLLATDAVGPWYFETVVWPAKWASGLGASASQLVPFPLHAWMMIAGVGALVLLLRALARHLSRPALRWLAATSCAPALAGGLWLGCCAPWTARVFVVFGFIGAIPWVLIAALLLTVGMAVRIGGWGNDLSAARFGTALLCLAAWIQVYPKFEPEHVYWAIAPSIGFLTYATWEASGRRTMLTALLFLLVGSAVAPVAFRSATTKLERRYVTLGAPLVLRGMRVPPEEAAYWDQLALVIAEYARTHPQVAILVEGPDALYATFAPNLENPGPFFVKWPGLVSDRGRQRAHFIRRKRPLIFRQALGLEALHFGPPGTQKEIASSLVASEMSALRYAPLANIGGVEILAPSP
jgi:hypothetical protein